MPKDPIFLLQYAVLGIFLALLLLEAVFDLRPQHLVAAPLRVLDALPPRMLRLLEHRGVRPRKLPVDIGPLELKRARAQCRSCGNVEKCESVIAGREDAGDYRFCANQALLSRFDRPESVLKAA